MRLRGELLEREIDMRDTRISQEYNLPVNIEAETTILGAILLDNEVFFDECMENTTAEDFSLDSNRRIYIVISQILLGMVEGVRHVDIVTLANELARRKEIEAVGGAAYLASLTEGLPMRPVIDEYVNILKEKSKLRRILRIFESGIVRAGDQSEPSVHIVGSVQEQLAEILGEGSNGTVRIGSVTPFIEKRVHEKRNVSTERTALEMTWGIEKLDAFTRGCFSGEFTVIGGESSGGKTAFAVQMSIANAKEGIPVIWFSLEMTKEALTQRFYPSMSEVLTNNHLRDPRLMNEGKHIPEMKKISEQLGHLPIDIDETSPMRIDKLRGRIKMMARKWKQERGKTKMLFIVDYLQLIKGIPRMTPLEQFSHILFTLRDIPKEEPDLHLVVLSQYSQGDKFIRKSGRTKDSLYGGSVIHHTAQNVFMIAMEDPEEKHELDLLAAELKIAKQREGRRGKVSFYFDRDHLRFCLPQRQL